MSTLSLNYSAEDKMRLDVKLAWAFFKREPSQKNYMHLTLALNSLRDRIRAH